jgi:hypothetical protein
MRRAALAPTLFLALAACSSPAKPSAPVEPAARFTYHAALARVPDGAGEVRLGVRVPARVQAGALSALSAFGLVGNAPFELALPSSPEGTLEREHLRLCWRPVDGERPAAREIVLTSHGKPLELGLRLALAVPAGASPDADALEAELAGATWAEADARPATGLETRCVRVR